MQSASTSDYVNNLTTFVDSGYDLTYGIGFLTEDAIKEVSTKYPNGHFAIVNTVVDNPNVTSITYKEHEGSFLVGVAAAMTTKTNKVGFVGGVDSDIIKKFEAGYIAGVHAVNPEIEVISNYATTFTKPEIGAQLASTIYGQDADIIYHAAATTGNGVFTEAKNRKKNGK